MNNYFFIACLALSGYISTAVAGDLIFQDGFDSLNAFSGEYAVKTQHDFGPAYPRNQNVGGLPMSGDHVDAIVDFIEFPTINLTAAVMSVSE